MDAFIAELIGTFLLILLGNGVVANVVLKQTKGENGGWIVITFGFAMAVFVAVLCVSEVSGAHINPAVTIGLAVADKFAWNLVPGYIIAQVVGAMLGGATVFLFYREHYKVSDVPEAKLATFCTTPNIPNTWNNLFSEIVGTFVLVLAVLCAAETTVNFGNSLDQKSAKVGLGALGALPVSLVVFAIGLGLGGTTGYGINPARDLGPRIAHALLPVPGKGDSQWNYAWIPVVGPIIGALVAVAVAAML